MNLRKDGARVVLMLLLFFVLTGVGIYADPSATEIQTVDKYKTQTFDPKGLKKLATQDDGWVQYEWTEGRFIYENPSSSTRAAVEPSGLEVYRYSSTDYEFDFPSGRIIKIDTKTGKMTWNPMEGEKAPNFDLPVLDGAGKRISLQSLKGKAILIDFWASWCGPCKEYMPQTSALYTKYSGRGLVVLGMNIEGDDSAARAFVKELGIKFQTVMAESGVDGYNWSAKQIADYGINSIPRGILIDKKGIIRAVDTVFSDTALLEKLLAE